MLVSVRRHVPGGPPEVPPAVLPPVAAAVAAPVAALAPSAAQTGAAQATEPTIGQEAHPKTEQKD